MMLNMSRREFKYFYLSTQQLKNEIIWQSKSRDLLNHLDTAISFPHVCSIQILFSIAALIAQNQDYSFMVSDKAVCEEGESPTTDRLQVVVAALLVTHLI